MTDEFNPKDPILSSDEKFSAEEGSDGYLCDSCALWDEIDGLKAQLAELKEENLDLKDELRRTLSELDGYKSAEEKSKKRLYEANVQADRLSAEAMYRYFTELKTLKLLADKYNDIFKSELDGQKKAIIDLLTDFLKDNDSDGYLYTAKEALTKLDEAVFGTKKLTPEEQAFYGDDVVFDLDEAINPKEELDLKTLLEELGITGGDKN